MNKHCNALWEPMIKAGEAGGGEGGEAGAGRKRSEKEERKGELLSHSYQP